MQRRIALKPAAASGWLRAAFLATLLAGVGSLAHCSSNSAAGVRCNPNEYSDPCNSGLSCRTNSCGISVCCPPETATNALPECRQDQADCPGDGGTAGSSGTGGAGGAGGTGGA